MSDKKKVIVVLQRGWVVTGDISQTGDQCTLTNAGVVRHWGTSKGLGQLAQEGPLPNTVIDASTPITYHALTAIMTLDCNGEAWARR